MRTGKDLKGVYEYFKELHDCSESAKEIFVSTSEADEALPQSQRMPRYCMENYRISSQKPFAEIKDKENGVPVRRLPPAGFLAAMLPREIPPPKGRVQPAELSILFWKAIYRNGWVSTEQIIEKIGELLHGMGKEVPDTLDVSLGRFLTKASDFFFQIEDNEGILWVMSDTST